MAHAFRARTLFLAVALAAPWPVVAGNLSYLNDTPYTHFTKEDHKIFNAALSDALEKAADGEARTWSNPASNASGELKPLKSFDRKGTRCRTLFLANKAKGRSASAEYNFCRQASGKWTLAN
jgi:surface antigen